MTNEIMPIGEKIVLYQNENGNVTAKVFFEDENFWLTQKAMGELFDVDVRTINEHLKNIYKSGELNEDSTIRKFRIVQKEGKRNVTRTPFFYNLDAIISVGYRVNSQKATQFRIWATNTLKEFIIKGFVLNDDQLKNGKNYLNQEEISNLDRLVVMFIDFAEMRALKHQVLEMNDWIEWIDKFLNFTDQKILETAGKISYKMAMVKTDKEYEKFRVKQDRNYISDFDREIKRLEGKKNEEN